MTDLLTELPTIVDTNFRFQNQKALLTYKTHIDKDALTLFLYAVGKDKVKKCYIAHENGANDPVTPYEHTHVVIDFGYAVQSRNARFLDFNGIHPHISKITNAVSWRKACQYICKEDKTVAIDTSDSGNQITDIWRHDTIQGALENMYDLKDALATIAVYKHKPMDLPEAEIAEADFYPWQKDMWDKLQKCPTGRKVIWVHDSLGNTGKTRFAKWCCLTHPTKCRMLNNVGRIADFAMNMQNFWNEGWRGNTVFLNLSRSYSDRTSIYEACEIIADGYITCTKYAGGVVWLPPMHIVVLSNFEPQVDRLSADRWEIFSVEEKTLDRCAHMAPVTLNMGAMGETSKGGYTM